MIPFGIGLLLLRDPVLKNVLHVLQSNHIIYGQSN